MNLGSTQASAMINGQAARVNYLVNVISVGAPLNTQLLTGDMFIGGYSDVQYLRVSLYTSLSLSLSLTHTHTHIHTHARAHTRTEKMLYVSK